MARHLKTCLPKSLQKEANEKGGKRHPFFLIQVSGRYATNYWMFLKVSALAPLEVLDNFLRDIWLECCGHMSAFSYKRHEVGMGRRLWDVLQPGMELQYEYDFGSTTELLIKVLGEHEGIMGKRRPIQVLCKNQAPEYFCEDCGKGRAVAICAECQCDGDGWLCQACAESHICGKEMQLPVVNSPRTGVCGYAGHGGRG
jgi:hypothetical protein